MIERTHNRTLFTAVRIDVLRSGLLTAEEIGLYTLMLSRPDNWEFSEFVLARELGTTPTDVRSILKRLEQKGFARERKGRYGTVWDLYELSAQLPAKKDHTIPQEVAKTFVDGILGAPAHAGGPLPAAQGTNDAQQTDDAADEDKAQVFFRAAAEMRKYAAEHRYKA